MSMLRITVLILMLGLSVYAQEKAAVADLLIVDVGLAYGYERVRMPHLPAGAVVLDERSEPGLSLQLSRVPIFAEQSIDMYSEMGSIKITWKNSPRRRNSIQLQVEEYHYYYSQTGSHYSSATKLWNSESCFGSSRERRGSPPIAGYALQNRYWICVPRLAEDDEERDELSPPILPAQLQFADVFKIATEHHARTSLASSKELIVNLSRFIPLQTEIPTNSLQTFLASLDLPTEMDWASGGNRRLRGKLRAFRRNKDSRNIRAHQGLVRSQRDTEFPVLDSERIGVEDYAVYRHMVEQGVLTGSDRSKALNLILDCSADVSAHESWLRLVSSPEFTVAPEEKEALIKRIKREISARSVPVLLGLAAVNLLGLAAIILLVRIVCARVMFR